MQIQRSPHFQRCSVRSNRPQALRIISMAKPSGLADAPPAGATEPEVYGTRVNPWGQSELKQKYSSLKEDLTVDVCVVGAGVAGLSTAYRLAKAGKSVVVLEARARGSGHSGRSTAYLSQWNSGYYKELIKIANKDRAKLVAQTHEDAISFVEQTVKEEGIKCQFERVPGYLFATRGSGGDATLSQELAACHEAGLKDVDVTRTAFAGKENYQGPLAIEFPVCANLHPLQYLEGLADAVVRKGGKIYEGTRVEAGVPGISGPTNGQVKVLGGPTVTAREAVVLATHSPINRDQLWVHNRQLPKRTYLVALEIPKGSLKPGQWYDVDEGNQHWVRTAPSPDGSKDLLIIEGEAHLHGKTTYPDTYGLLEQWARRLFPQAGSRAFAWSSMQYYPADLLPLAGRDPADFTNKVPNYIITGYSGQEFGGGTIGSAVVASQILKESSAKSLADVYKPGRVFSSAASKYAKELGIYFSWLGASFAQYVAIRSFDDIQGFLSPKSVEDKLKPGEGAVVQHGWRKAALFRDAEGLMHRKSAVCTHLGCQVEWNPLDKSFDCPCHGSQYTGCGQCVNAPAVVDLEDLGSDRRP